MRSISLYTERNTVIHAMDPISKLFYILFALLIPIILPSIKVSIVCVVLGLIFLLVARVFKKTIPVFSFVFLILLTVIIIQGLFRPGNQTTLFHFGPFTLYKEGLMFAFGVAFRVINIVSAFMILILTTKPSDLVESLVRKGLSSKIGYVIISVFQIIPEMMSSMETITDAQRSRGMETEGNLQTRMKAFLPLLGPVILGSLANTKERAMALEVRGFNSKGPKTYLLEEKKYRYSKVVQWGILLGIACALAWRILV
ncbi:MAG: energy-coupling factor transporter transmembrane component T [Bacillota bacterium]|nr:energy-coupling factor transporter transmembrane component T [Bacillota bacterium]